MEPSYIPLHSELYTVMQFLRGRWHIETPNLIKHVKSFILYAFNKTPGVFQFCQSITIHKFKQTSSLYCPNSKYHTLLVQYCKKYQLNINYIVIPSVKDCKICAQKLHISNGNCVWIYDTKHAGDLGVRGTYHYKTCFTCKSEYDIGFNTILKNTTKCRQFDTNRNKNNLWQDTRETIFKTDDLSDLKPQITIGKNGIYTIEGILNAQHNNDFTMKKGKIAQTLFQNITNKKINQDPRKGIDRRRLQSALHNFMTHEMAVTYGNPNDKTLFVDDTFTDEGWRLKVIQEIIWVFAYKWTNHRCLYPGCTNTKILDGNHKFRCKICCSKWTSCIKRAGEYFPVGCLQFPSAKCNGYCKDCYEFINTDFENNDSAFQQLINLYNTNIARCEAENNYVIEKIISKRRIKVGDKFEIQYRVKWFGYALTGVDIIQGQQVPYDGWVKNTNVPVAFRKLFDQENNIKANQAPTNKHYIECGIGLFNDRINTLISDLFSSEETKQEGMCSNVNKEDPELKDINDEVERKHIKSKRTCGIATINSPCMIVNAFFPMFRSESLGLWYHFLLDWVKNCNVKQLYPSLKLLYDDVCHFKDYVQKNKRLQLVDDKESALYLAHMVEYYLDRFHVRNHVDECIHKYDIKNQSEQVQKELKNVNTQACEAMYKWLSAFKSITMNMSYSTYIVFAMCLFHEHNTKMTETLKNTGCQPHFAWNDNTQNE